MIRDLCQYLQPGFNSYRRFEERLGHSSQRLEAQIFCFNNSGTRKIKNLQNFPNTEIHVTLQSDNTKHKPFQFISWSNFIGFQNLSPGFGGKVSTH